MGATRSEYWPCSNHAKLLETHQVGFADAIAAVCGTSEAGAQQSTTTTYNCPISQWLPVPSRATGEESCHMLARAASMVAARGHCISTIQLSKVTQPLQLHGWVLQQPNRSLAPLSGAQQPYTARWLWVSVSSAWALPVPGLSCGAAPTGLPGLYAAWRTGLQSRLPRAPRLLFAQEVQTQSPSIVYVALGGSRSPRATYSYLATSPPFPPHCLACHPPIAPESCSEASRLVSAPPPPQVCIAAV